MRPLQYFALVGADLLLLCFFGFWYIQGSEESGEKERVEMFGDLLEQLYGLFTPKDQEGRDFNILGIPEVSLHLMIPKRFPI